MKCIRFFIYLFLINLTYSCSTIEEGFSNKKKNSSDEFLVEKKSPLVMPPDYNELPIPKTGEENPEKKENEIKKLLTSKKDLTNNTDISSPENLSFEQKLLKKIKSN